MAYRNTIISLASLVALGTACSKAPSYNTGVQSAATENADAAATVSDDPGHGPAVPTTTAEAPKETPKPAETPAAPPANKPADPAAPKPLTDAERAKAMNTKGFVAYAVAANDGAGWNTAATPFLIAPSVSAAGAVDGAKPFDAIFCNYRGAGLNMQLHSSSGDGPAAHGQAIAGADLPADPANPAAKLTMAQAEAKLNAYPTAAALLAENPNCRAHRINALGATPGATYNHRGGNEGNAASHVHFKIMTVDPAGVVK